ncbi:MAG: serine/threonine protein kinase [Planctomycetia bacterium]|nr:serine/threonine protein kinase [Planctomycetia bacterium]
MSQAADNLAETDASRVWQQLLEHLDAFVAAWQDAAEPPVLAEFLPNAAGALRRLTLIEAIKVDLEYRWQQRRWPKTMEDYLREFPELLAGGVPCDIVYEEYHVRRQQGDDVSIGEYFDRFPAHEHELRRLLQLESPEQSAALVNADRVPPFEPGQRLDDFDLLASLGKGAFATVFLARQCSMQRLVALKVSRDRGFEPQTLAQLDHPHIVRVFDQRRLPALKLRLLYMQYVAGGTLHDVVEHTRQVPAAMRSGATLLEAIDLALGHHGQQPPADSMTRYKLQKATWPEVVCWVGARLAGALAYAHQRGVLHRDVKPANVLVGADGHPKLADFNISFSKLDGATAAAYFGGSLAYMSPEQLEACNPAHARKPEELDGRSDIFSLGVLLWELLTTRRPFAEDALPQTQTQMLAKMTNVRRGGVSPQAHALVPIDCPPTVVEVLLKCLEPEAGGRYQSAAELARELDLCLQPRAQALLHSRHALISVVKRHPVASTLLFGLLPNIVMCVLNIAYNWKEIVDRLGSPDDERAFFNLILGINSIAYTLGLGYVFYTRGRLFVTLGRLARGQKTEPPPSTDLVRRALTFGAATAMVTALLWTVSGFVIPAWIHYGAGSTSRLSPEHFRHFVVSNLLCGMIAATQSYYVVTFFSVRFGYPWLLQARPADARDVSDLADLARRGRLFLGLTVAVPFLALSALVLLNFDRAVIGILGAIGLVGCGLAYLLDLTLRGDLAALTASMDPGGDPLFAGEPPDSFLTGSR